jgi:predicted nucleic acid-binding protein
MIENNDIYNIFICSTIYMEVLRGIRDDKVFSNIKETLLNFGILDIDMMTVTNMAIDIYRSLRKKGITIRKQNDCLIASYAILNDIPVFHKDRDFELIEKETKMNTYKKQ